MSKIEIKEHLSFPFTLNCRPSFTANLGAKPGTGYVEGLTSPNNKQRTKFLILKEFASKHDLGAYLQWFIISRDTNANLFAKMLPILS